MSLLLITQRNTLSNAQFVLLLKGRKGKNNNDDPTEETDDTPPEDTPEE